MAVCTSSAALSTLRESSNCTAIEVEPSALVEVSDVTPGNTASARSSGAVTDEAMVCALAPGNPASIEMVGISTWGTPAIGNCV